MPAPDIKLGVNIDHAATIRQQRLTTYPNLSEIVAAAEAGGADGITLHLREDRRHIQDQDVYDLKRVIQTKMNLEMATTAEMLAIACDVMPEDVCLVPEKRAELTTEGGLEVANNFNHIKQVCDTLTGASIRTSLFIEPALEQVSAAAEAGAGVVELHTGRYAELSAAKQAEELDRLFAAAEKAHELGLLVNAGHGLEYENVIAVSKLPHLYELNIGHSIVARSLLVGFERAVSEMRALLR